MRLAKKGLPTSGRPISTTTCISPSAESAAIGGGSSVGSGLYSDLLSRCSCDLTYDCDSDGGAMVGRGHSVHHLPKVGTRLGRGGGAGVRDGRWAILATAVDDNQGIGGGLGN